jgi:hypothetical protein
MRVLVIANTVIWAALSWLGWDGLISISAQKVEGYPNHGLTQFYLYIPLGMLVLAVAGYFIPRFGRVRYFALTVEALLLVTVVPFLALYGGGV